MRRELLIGLLLVALALAVVVVSGSDDPTAARKKRKNRVPAMARNTYIVATKDSAGGDGEVRSVTVVCDAGDKLLSGGYDELDAESTLRSNSPSTGDVGNNLANEWTVAWRTTGGDDLVDVFALCSDFPPLHEQ